MREQPPRTPAGPGIAADTRGGGCVKILRMAITLPSHGHHNPLEAEPIGALRLLFWLRLVAVLSQALVIALVHFGLDIRLPLLPLALTIGALAAWNLITLPRLQAQRAVSAAELALHFCVDIAAFTSVIYWTGGPANPFVSLYLVPISLAAISLPSGYAWLVVGLCGMGYSALWLRHVPLPPVASRFGSDFNLHMTGMWVNFLVAAALIVFFVGRIARIVRQRDLELAAMRESTLRDQQIIALGTLAAGTAHEINTPLGTLALLVEELQDTGADRHYGTQLELMREQIERINDRLNRIVGGTGAERSTGARSLSLRSFVDGVLTPWSAGNPELEIRMHVELTNPGLPIAVEATIEQAIRNVLDNAAYATRQNAHHTITVQVGDADAVLTIIVADQGIGLEPRLRDDIGLKVLSTKERGLGIGLLLSRAALQRFGGTLALRNRADGGVEAELHVPLTELAAHAG
jgi:two-component system sensor histidine kinase RegB